MSKAQDNTFLAYLNNRLPLAEEALLDVRARATETNVAAPVNDLDTYLYNPLLRFTLSGGKRIRPILAFLGAEAVGKNPSCAKSVAAAIEIFQSAALIHDDIADKGELRRDEPCMHVTEGTGIALNTGDLALVRVLEIVLSDSTFSPETTLELAKLLINMQRHTLEGQALDIGWARDKRWDISEDDYLYMIKSKTAWYSAAIPLVAGAKAACGTAQATKGLLAVGLDAGMAFQLTDDLLNLVGDPVVQGKDFCSDVTEGKRTLPVIHALGSSSALSKAKKEKLIALLDAHVTDKTSLAQAVELIYEGDGISYAEACAKTHASNAKAKIRDLADEGHITMDSANILTSMADFFVYRMA